MAERQSQHRRDRRWIFAVYVALLLLVVPWYWPANDTSLAFGFPVWALATLAAVFATSVFTAWVYLTRSDEPDD